MDGLASTPDGWIVEATTIAVSVVPVIEAGRGRRAARDVLRWVGGKEQARTPCGVRARQVRQRDLLLLLFVSLS